ncbi:hypothetical protein [Corynebacterium flavescens]|uniref:hypothetical protein n=1 Tax=Corynebacterium flavescens TaxID=28028 RepID=UPI003FD02DC0
MMVGEDEVHESTALVRALRQAGDLDAQGAAVQLGWSLEASALSRAAPLTSISRQDGWLQTWPLP